MYRFRQWLARFMVGRYGMDELNRCLSIATLVLIVVDLFVNWRPVDILVLVGLVALYFRMFSRNHNARYQENMRFLGLLDQLQGWLGVRKGGSGRGGGFGRRQNAGSGNSYGGSHRRTGGFNQRAAGGFGQTQTGGPDFTVVGDEAHTILRCPGCGAALRVPTGAGNILVKCPHCGERFKKTV